MWIRVNVFFYFESLVLLFKHYGNIHINKNVTRDEFIAMREGRDAQLSVPKLILPSIQVNVCAGQLPEPEDNDLRYLKIPLDAL